METELARITQRAREHFEEKFNSLMGRVFNLERLHESFQAQSRKKSPGIDGIYSTRSSIRFLETSNWRQLRR